MSKLSIIALVSVVALSATLASMAAPQDAPSKDAAPVILTPADLKWVDGPPSLPAGSKMVVLAGSPKEPGLFAMRLKLPANYKIPPHQHGANENITIISGSLFVSAGDSFDASKGKELTVGSFGLLPAKLAHFAYTKEETIVQANSIGPWEITYVNPSDDPRNAKK